MPAKKDSEPGMENESSRGYRFIDDLTSDVFFEAWGKTQGDMFVAAAEALMDVSSDFKKIRPKKAVKIAVKGRNIEDLMLSWLQAVIQTMEIEETFFSNFEIEKMDPKGKFIEATAYGEEMRTELGGTHVKGVTYYKFSVINEKGVWKATVSLDV